MAADQRREQGNTRTVGLIAALVGGVAAGAALTYIYFQPPLQPAAPHEPTEAAIPPPPAPAPPPAAAQPAPTAPVPEAPDTQASSRSEEPEYLLKGVYVSDDPSRTLALISDGSGPAKVFRVGQAIGNGYSLRSVGEKSAEIEKNGKILEIPLIRGTPGSDEAVAEETSREAGSLSMPQPTNADFQRWWKEHAQVPDEPAGQEAATAKAPGEAGNMAAPEVSPKENGTTN